VSTLVGRLLVLYELSTAIVVVSSIRIVEHFQKMSIFLPRLPRIAGSDHLLPT
jgi:hypothetical protein